MCRSLRPNCPGLAFHITTRVTGRAHAFDGVLRPRIVHLMAESATRSDARVLAYAVMSNHLHMIVRQGDLPLFRLMQPLLRRVALLVQRHSGLEGHVFERTFRTHPCLTAAHLRDAIVYTHLNPVRAGECAHPDAADATSHTIYTGAADASAVGRQFVLPAHELFANDREIGEGEAARDYCAHVAYRQACDTDDELERARSLAPPECDRGDEFFALNFVAVAESVTAPALRRIDLRDLALCVIRAETPDVPLTAFRGKSLASSRLREVRHTIIRRATSAGHAGVAIAAFFMISPGRVSQIARSGSRA